MDSLPAVPPDLAALAVPSVRGAAPLLGSVESEHAEASAASPFELCLALLTAPPPSGEAMPPGGKDLPVLSLEFAADSASAPSTAELMLVLAPAAAAVQAQLRPAQPAALPADGLPAPPLPVVDAAAGASTLLASLPGMPEALVTAPLDAAPTFESASAAAAVQTPSETVMELSPEPPPEVSAATDAAVASETAERRATAGAAKSIADATRFDGLTANDRRFESPAVQRPEPRANGASLPPQPVAAPQYQAVAAAATPTVEVGAVAQSTARRGELQKVVLPAGASGDGGGIAQTDWLPASGSSGTAAHALAPPSQAAPGAPVDTRLPTWHEAFASRVQWLVDHVVGEAHIKLNPPELGAVDVKISLVDDQTFVQLTTATTAARDELSQSLPRLRELLAGSGLELGGASVQSGRDGQQSAYGQGASAGSREPHWLASFSTGADEPPLRSPRSSPGRIDVFA
jgi:flagellar hook-length control protein FliK